MRDDAHELLKSDLMRMAELLERLSVNTLPPASKIAESFATSTTRGNKSLLALSADNIQVTLQIAHDIHEHIRIATDPRTEMARCIGIFRDDGGTALAYAVVLCTGDELNQGHHYDMVREWAEDHAGYDVAIGDPVVDDNDGEFSSFSTFEWSSISPRDWLVSAQIRATFLLE